MRNLLALAAVSLAFGPQWAAAENDLSYTWVELDYAQIDVDDFDDGEVDEDFDDGGGWALRGSFAFTDQFFAFGSFSKTDADTDFQSEGQVFASADADIERLNIGLGYAIPLDRNYRYETDVVLRAAYTDIDVGNFGVGGSSGDDSFDDLNEDSSDGWFVDASLRSQLATWLEGTLGVQYTDIEKSDNFSLLVGGLFEVTDNVGINLEGNIGDDISSFYLGARYSFDWPL